MKGYGKDGPRDVLSVALNRKDLICMLNIKKDTYKKVVGK